MKAPKPLNAPFPYFGGKRRAASLVWGALGSPGVYIEPFAGSCAVLLGRPDYSPDVRRKETINDLNGQITNLWRAIKANPQGVARGVDAPANELDFHARKAKKLAWDADPQNVERLRADIDWFDLDAACVWIWGQCTAIASGWTAPGNSRQIIAIAGVKHGGGVHAARDTPALLEALAARLRYVKVCCGDWRRVLSPSAWATRPQVTGVFLDPPYQGTEGVYGGRSRSVGVSADVQAWALEHGDNPLARIVVAGRGDDHAALVEAGWSVANWEARGGFNTTDKDARLTERLWLSPHCLPLKLAV